MKDYWSRGSSGWMNGTLQAELQTTTEQKLWLFHLSERQSTKKKLQSASCCQHWGVSSMNNFTMMGFHLGYLIQLGEGKWDNWKYNQPTPSHLSIFLRKFLTPEDGFFTLWNMLKSSHGWYCYHIHAKKKKKKSKLLSRNEEKAHSVPTASEVITYKREFCWQKKTPTLLQNGISDHWSRSEENNFVSVPQLQ